MSWVFVDDVPDAAQSFADEFAKGPRGIQVQVLGPLEAKAQLLSGRIAPSGVLMDVELSNAAGELGSGPGLAQDIRVQQRSKLISEYPVVRFAARVPIERYVKGDPASDDLFDLKILKESLREDLFEIQLKLKGLESVYRSLLAIERRDLTAIEELLGLQGNSLSRWSHEAFHARILSTLDVPHVAAGVFLRSFLTPTGLLIDERVLSYRLGVGISESGEAWPSLRDRLPCRYTGVAAESFPRWWSRGLDDWWFETIKGARPLVSLTIAERIAVLRDIVGGLRPLSMPEGSAGDKPWRLCALSLETDPPIFIPIDPSESVRFSPRADAPVWVDPTFASLRIALQAREDYRLNREDLVRLKRKQDKKRP